MTVIDTSLTPTFEWASTQIHCDLTIEIRFEVDATTLEVLRSQLADAVALRPQRLIIDLEGCEGMCEEGREVISEAQAICDLAGTEFVLLGCPPAP